MPHGDGGLFGLATGLIMLTLVCGVCGKTFEGLFGETECEKCQAKSDQSTQKPKSILDEDFRPFADIE